jgi:hypothetical protein
LCRDLSRRCSTSGCVVFPRRTSQEDRGRRQLPRGVQTICVGDRRILNMRAARGGLNTARSPATRRYR